MSKSLRAYGSCPFLLKIWFISLEKNYLTVSSSFSCVRLSKTFLERKVATYLFENPYPRSLVCRSLTPSATLIRRVFSSMCSYYIYCWTISTHHNFCINFFEQWERQQGHLLPFPGSAYRSKLYIQAMWKRCVQERRYVGLFHRFMRHMEHC